MTSKTFLVIVLALSPALFLNGCGSKAEANATAEAPPPVKVEDEQNAGIFKVEHPGGVSN